MINVLPCGCMTNKVTTFTPNGIRQLLLGGETLIIDNKKKNEMAFYELKEGGHVQGIILWNEMQDSMHRKFTLTEAVGVIQRHWEQGYGLSYSKIEIVINKEDIGLICRAE